MRNNVVDRDCAGEAELVQLNEGMLALEETKRLNRHIAVCGDCRRRYRAIAVARKPEASGTGASIRKFFFDYRSAAGAEREISLPEPIEMKETELDRIISDIAGDSGRFLVSGGKLESLLDDLKTGIEKLGKAPTLSPEGEKSFISFLSKCVIENVEDVTGEDEEVEMNIFADLFSRLKQVADGSVIGLQDIAVFREAGEAYEEKIANLLSKFRKGSAGHEN